MNKVRKIWILFAAAIALLAAIACNGNSDVAAQTNETAGIPETPALTETPDAPVSATPVVTEPPTPDPTPEPTATPTPEPTPVPTPQLITIGAVGDIMLSGAMVEYAKTEDGTYDFSILFLPVRELFESVDLMCGNLEVPLAGEESGYGTIKGAKSSSFNAPDSLLDPLKEYGLDLLTTGNNHVFDRGIKGLYRTIEVVRAAGFYQTGTYLNEEDRMTPCIIDVNGIKIGIVAATRLMNQGFIDTNRQDAYKAFGYYMNDGMKLTSHCKDSIARTRAAGAEFVILFAHWDFENDKPTSSDTKALAKQALAAGADCIIGSHPHRIKGAEYVTVEREDGPYTGLVLYSLGNFSAQMNFNCMVGLFAKITLQKDFATGKVTLYEAGVLPTLSMRRDDGKRRWITVVPAYADPSLITGLDIPLTEAELKTIRSARELAFRRLGQVEGLEILDESTASDETGQTEPTETTVQPSEEPTLD